MIRRLFQCPIRLYQIFISPWFVGQCRYAPTCSHYAKDAVRRHGVMKGIILASLRILRCNPLNKNFGHDPVPQRFAWRQILGYKQASKDIEP